nr:lysine-rich arabinogalactan protein 19-like [Aegilops tauschii subsp. strangulata]
MRSSTRMHLPCLSPRVVAIPCSWPCLPASKHALPAPRSPHVATAPPGLASARLPCSPWPPDAVPSAARCTAPLRLPCPCSARATPPPPPPRQLARAIARLAYAPSAPRRSATVGASRRGHGLIRPQVPRASRSSAPRTTPHIRPVASLLRCRAGTQHRPPAPLRPLVAVATGRPASFPPVDLGGCPAPAPAGRSRPTQFGLWATDRWA